MHLRVLEYCCKEGNNAKFSHTFLFNNECTCNVSAEFVQMSKKGVFVFDLTKKNAHNSGFMDIWLCPSKDLHDSSQQGVRNV